MLHNPGKDMLPLIMEERGYSTKMLPDLAHVYVQEAWAIDRGSQNIRLHQVELIELGACF